jgi:sorting nexin-29
MLEFGIPPKLVRLTRATTAQVKLQIKLSNSFRIGNGLRQGDSLACILFNIILEKIIRGANINQRGNILYTCVQML